MKKFFCLLLSFVCVIHFKPMKSSGSIDQVIWSVAGLTIELYFLGKKINTNIENIILSYYLKRKKLSIIQKIQNTELISIESLIEPDFGNNDQFKNQRLQARRFVWEGYFDIINTYINNNINNLGITPLQLISYAKSYKNSLKKPLQPLRKPKHSLLIFNSKYSLKIMDFVFEFCERNEIDNRNIDITDDCDDSKVFACTKSKYNEDFERIGEIIMFNKKILEKIVNNDLGYSEIIFCFSHELGHIIGQHSFIMSLLNCLISYEREENIIPDTMNDYDLLVSFREFKADSLVFLSDRHAALSVIYIIIEI